MRYKQKIVKLPDGFKVGTEVYVMGEGGATFRVTEIHYREDGSVYDVSLSCGWREPLHKMAVYNGQDMCDAFDNPNNRIDVAVGECDFCGKKFPDSCIYNTTGDPNSMICEDCWETKYPSREQKSTSIEIHLYDVARMDKKACNEFANMLVRMADDIRENSMDGDKDFVDRNPSAEIRDKGKIIGRTVISKRTSKVRDHEDPKGGMCILN